MKTSKRLQTRLTGSDWFCGAGGSSEGAVWAGLEMVAAANHWDLAIETHNTNHPDVDHYLTNLSQADPRYFPSTNFLIASPECTNHSLAKGSRRKNQAQLSLFDQQKIDPAEERSRATMYCVPRFAEAHNYDIIVVENVVDIWHWTPMIGWLKIMGLLGYNFQTCYFNSMFFNPINGMSDYPPQSRDRVYFVFWKKGNPKPDLDFRPLGWCVKCETNVNAVQSWKNPEKRWGRYGERRQYVYRCPACAETVEPYYYAAWNAIDWSIEAPRIGDRKRPLKKNTLRRIEIGLEKFGKQSLLVQVNYSHARNNRTYPLTDPLPTQTARQNLAFLVRMKGPAASSSKRLTEPMPTLTTVGTPYIIEMHGGNDARGIDDPLHCVLAGGNHHGLVMPQPFTVEMYGKSLAKGLDDPLSCVLGNVHHGMIVPPPFLVGIYGPEGQRKAVDLGAPLQTLSTTPTWSLIMPQPFLTAYYGSSDQVSGLGEASPTVTTVDRLGLATPEREGAEQELRVEDCGFRMLQPHEIKDAMGFGPEYVLLGTKREQVKLAGNAVTPPVMEWLTRQCIKTFE